MQLTELSQDRMKFVIVTYLLALVSQAAWCQNKWAYASASITSDSGEVYYVSELINLSALACVIDTSRSEGDVMVIEAYRQCIAQWFYNRVKALNDPRVAMLELKNVSAEFERFKDYTRLFGKKRSNLTFTPPKNNYMAYAVARNKRKQDMAYCRAGKCVIVYVE